MIGIILKFIEIKKTDSSLLYNVIYMNKEKITKNITESYISGQKLDISLKCQNKEQLKSTVKMLFDIFQDIKIKNNKSVFQHSFLYLQEFWNRDNFNCIWRLTHTNTLNSFFLI